MLWPSKELPCVGMGVLSGAHSVDDISEIYGYTAPQEKAGLGCDIRLQFLPLREEVNERWSNAYNMGSAVLVLALRWHR